MFAVRWVGLFLVAALNLGSDRASASQAAQRYTIEPAAYRSRTGEYVLEVDPSHRTGGGPASYRALRNGREVWKKRLPFTLQEAVVADDGTAAGYAYSRGLEGYGPADDHTRGPGDFRIVILDPAGGLSLDRAVPRQESRFVHALPDPRAAGVFLDADADRVTVRINDADLNRGREEWRPFRLSTGEAQPVIYPRELMTDSKPARFVLDARAIRGTPLTLVHWWRFAEGQVGARFTLIEQDGRAVWSLELPHDYTLPHDGKAEYRLGQWIREHGAILATDRPGEFELRHVAAGQRVRYSLAQVEGKWQVHETGRVPAAPVPPVDATAAPVPSRTLPFRGSITLRAPAVSEPELRHVVDFAVDGQGRFALLREEETGPPTFMLVSPQGRVLRRVRLDAIRQDEAREWTGFTWVGDDRFVLTRSHRKWRGPSAAWWIDFSNGSVVEVPQFAAPPIRRICGRADGSFVVLGNSHASTDAGHSVRGYDARGREQWKVAGARSSDDPAGLISPEDLTVTTSGEVAVLDVSRKIVQLFDRSGRHLKVIDLEKSWKREPRYPTQIAADSHDGLVIEDLQGPVPIVRMRADGSVRSDLHPRFADGRDFHPFQIAVGPDGRLWTCDSFSLLRLDKVGRVDRVVGPKPSMDTLGAIQAVRLDGRDRIHAASFRTGAVHVFDPRGRHLHVCRPGPAELNDPSGARLIVTERGEVYLGYDRRRRYLHFGPDGRRRGLMARANAQPGLWLFGADARSQWTVNYERISLTRPGQAVRLIERTPENTWLSQLEAAAVAPDGALAIMAGRLREPYKVHLYSPTGEALRSIEVATTCGTPYSLTFDRELLIIGTGRGILAYDRGGKLLWSFSPPVAGKVGWWRPYLTRGGELWLYDGKKTLYRYALPE